MLGIVFGALVAVASGPVAPTASTGGDNVRLTVADVEKVAGVSGVKEVARMSQPGAGGELNFAGPDGKLLLMVNFGTAQLYTKARQQKDIKVGGTSYPMPLYAHDVPGVGDEAFDSPPGNIQYVLYVRKGDKAISVTTYMSRQGKPLLTIAQLKTIAQTILSRW
jgi:hypothetical protein